MTTVAEQENAASEAQGTVVDFPPVPDGRPTNSDLLASLNEIRQLVHQLGENYSKLYAASFPITDCKGLAHILGKSEGTIRRWTDDRIIPAIKMPSGEDKFTYLYNLKRVEETLEDYST